MSQDIFISYSRNDLEKAQVLAQLLTSAGLSVWIDQTGIDVSTSWSGEIVDAIGACKALIVLLSPSSVASKNVVREVALAFEKNKKILPLELEPVTLSRDLEYHLAGIQRAPMTNIDSIIRTLGKLGLEATQAATLKIVKETDARKSLMILPFQDLSPTGDNGWFADGIVSELIQALSTVKALHVTDAQTTKDFKRYQGTLPNYAKEMQVRYFVEGDVRKFGDQIKVNTRLLDIETGDHLWQDSLKGTMDDIFDIQEQVAQKVVEGLKLHLGSEEKKRLSERGTENAEAYELFLKATEYFDRNTKEGFELSAQLMSAAITLDKGYAHAYGGKANALVFLYRMFVRDARLLDEALLLIREALRLKPDFWKAYYPLSQILLSQGKLEEAESVVNEYVRHAPAEYLSHGSQGVLYEQIGQYSKAIASYEEALKLNPNNLVTYLNLVLTCNRAREVKKKRDYAFGAIPKYEQYLKLFPNDEHKRVSYAILLHYAERLDEARAVAGTLGNLTDGAALYNLACLQCVMHDYSEGLATFRKSIEAGYRSLNSAQALLHAEKEGFGTLKGTPQWELVRQLVEKTKAEHTAEEGTSANG